MPRVLVLPQRQTALVAKQVAQIDLLSGGRVRLGVGIGWNHVEYESLGMDFRRRARRLEEQLPLLRRPEEWIDRVDQWEAAGGTHAAVLPEGVGAALIDNLHRCREALAVLLT